MKSGCFVPCRGVKVIGSGKLPWERVTRAEALRVIDFLKTKRLGLISISKHDSCDWTVDEFKKAFPDIYVDLTVGVPIELP